jgi:hypothetical protein
MQSSSPLLAWFFTLILVLLAARAGARLAVARRGGAEHALASAERHREFGHAAMGLGMAVLLAPGLPRPPQPVSVCFFAALAVLAALDWARRAWAAGRGRALPGCGPSEGGRLLDPHHALVGVAMVVMLLRPATSSAGIAGMSSMAGMTAAGASPGATTLLLLGYVWVAALVLGYGMTRVLATPQGTAQSGTTAVLLSSPATAYACELAMTVLTGLMLLS